MTTGKEILSEKEFRQQHQPLIDLLSNGAHQMVALENHLYLEGVDGKFYRYDGKTLSEEPKAKDYLSSRFFIETSLPGYFAIHPQPVEDDQAINSFSQAVLTEPAIQVYQNLEPKVIDVDIAQKTAIVSYRKTQRESADRILLLYDMNKHQIIWEENIGIINQEQQQPGVRTLKNTYVIQAGDRLVVLDKETRKKVVHYHLRWNRPIVD